MRSPLTVLVACGLLVSAAAAGPQAPDGKVRIECSVRYAQIVTRVQPAYPELARQVHLQGTVVLDCLIGRDGSVKRIRVRKGPGLLVQAALDAVSQWKYKPVLLNGKAIEVNTSVKVIFELADELKKPATGKDPPA